MKLSTNEGDVLVTYSLGSCLGLSLWDPVAHVGGLIHCMLPLSKIDPVKAKTNPYMFTDTGLDPDNMCIERGVNLASVFFGQEDFIV